MKGALRPRAPTQKRTRSDSRGGEKSPLREGQGDSTQRSSSSGQATQHSLSWKTREERREGGIAQGRKVREAVNRSAVK